MNFFRSILIFTLVLTLLSACAPKATSTPAFQAHNPYAPQPGDSILMANGIKIDSASVVVLESQPPQLVVRIAYVLPTRCHQLRVEVSGPDDQNRIELKAYAVAEKDQACDLMTTGTPLHASLNLGSFPKGHYTVFLNDQQIGEFDS